MSREYTKEEVRKMVLEHMRHLAQYWAIIPKDVTVLERCEGVAFSILNIFDGTSSGLPAFDLVVRPHPDDKQFHIDEGENYMPDGLVINDDCHLHDLFYAKGRAQPAAQAAQQGGAA